MSSRFRDLIAATLISVDIPLVGDVYFIGTDTTGTVGKYWNQLVDSDKFFASTTSLSSVTMANASTGQNDTFILAPTSHVLQSSMTWDKPAVHLVGAYPPVWFGHRARMGHTAGSTTLSPMINLASTGTVFANFRMQHGLSGTTKNYIALQVTGNRNLVKHVHVASPMDSTLGDSSGLRSVQLSGAHENYFHRCTFGDDTIKRSTANCLLHFTGSNGKNIFEDCLFLAMIDSSKPFMIQTTGAGDINGMVFFKNCHFIARSVNNAKTMELMIDADADLADSIMCFDKQCLTYGIDDIVSTAAAPYVWWGDSTGGAAYAGLSIHPSTA